MKEHAFFATLTGKWSHFEKHRLRFGHVNLPMRWYVDTVPDVPYVIAKYDLSNGCLFGCVED